MFEANLINNRQLNISKIRLFIWRIAKYQLNKPKHFLDVYLRPASICGVSNYV